MNHHNLEKCRTCSGRGFYVGYPADTGATCQSCGGSGIGLASVSTHTFEDSEHKDGRCGRCGCVRAATVHVVTHGHGRKPGSDRTLCGIAGGAPDSDKIGAITCPRCRDVLHLAHAIAEQR